MSAALDALAGHAAADLANGAVMLDRRTLQSRPALRLFATLLGQEALTLDEPVLHPRGPAGEVRIDGRASILGIERCRTEVAVADGPGGDLQVTVTLIPPEGWRFGQSFPSLAGTDLHDVPLSDPRLILSSHGPDGTERTVRDALEFEGKVALGTLYGGLGPMLGSLVQAEMRGPIRIARLVRTAEIDTAETLGLAALDAADAKIEVELSTDLGLSLDLPGMKLRDLDLRIEGPHVVDWMPYPDLRKSVRATLDIGGKGVTIEGGMSSAGLLSLYVQPDDLRLSGLAALADLVPGVDLKGALPPGLKKLGAVAIRNLDAVIDTTDGSVAHLGIGLSLEAEWSLPGDIARIGAFTAYFMVSGLGRAKPVLGCTFGADLSIGRMTMRVTGYAPEFVLTATIDDLPLSRMIADALPDLAPAVEMLPEIDLSDVHLSLAPKDGVVGIRAVSDAVWRVGVGPAGLEIRDLRFEFNRRRVPEGNDEPAVYGLLAGRLEIGETDIEVEYKFPGDLLLRGNFPEVDFSPLIQRVAGTAALRDTPMPEALLNLKLTDVYVVVAPQRGHFQIAARTPIGETELLVRKTANGSWGCALGIAAAPDWRLSSLGGGLEALDGLKFSQLALVLSTSDDPAMQLSLVNPSRPAIQLNRDRLGTAAPAPLDSRMRRGLNLFAGLAADGTGVDKLGIDQLSVYAAIGPSPADMVLEARVEGRIALGPDATMTDVGFRLAPVPLSVVLFGTVEAQIGDDLLKFVGGLEVQPTGAAIQTTMLGDWTEPFDVRELTVSNVALDLGISFATLLPTVGIAGTVRVGTVEGAAAVRFDTINPGRSMLSAQLSRLTVIDVVDTFCPPDLRRDLPAETRRMLTATGLEDVDIHIAPMPTRIGELEFDQGIRLKGALFAPGFAAACDIVLDPERGMKIAGAMTPIEIAGVFRLTGVRGLPGPSLNVALMRGEPFVFAVQGAVALLGLEAEAFVHITDSAFEFEVTGKIYDLFEAHVHAKGSRLGSDAGFWIVVEMQNDLMEYLRREATEAIRAAADDAIRKLSDAQRTIDNAQRELSRLNAQIETARAQVRADRARDQQNLRNARAKVQDAQNAVATIDRNIEAARAQVRADRARDQANLRRAQSDVANAQREVNKLQGEIDNQKRWINTLKSRIASKKRWLDGKKWYDKVWAGPEYTAYAAARSAEISVAYTKIGGLETAKGAAWGVLEAAKAIVRETEKLSKTFPIDADPRVAGLFAGRGTAMAGLEAAKGVLRGLEELSKTFPIDADPRVASLFALRDSAWVAMEGAEKVLEGVKLSVGGLADVGEHIAKFGLGGLLDVKRARFEAALAATRGGMVDLELDLAFMGKRPETLKLAFNFHNPLDGAKRLAERLLPN